jgi:hypothetical protein
MRKRFRNFRDWRPQPPDPGSSKLKRYSAPKYIGRPVRNKWGYAPIATGLGLVLLGVVTLTVQLIVNGDLFSFTNYADRFNFWYFWAPIISYSLIVGAFLAVVGIAIFRGIRNILSYASITGGFILILIDVYTLFVNWVKPNINVIGYDDFSSFSVGLFSYLMAGAFFMVLGIIVGLRVKGKLGYVSISGGLALVLIGVSILLVNLGDHTSQDWYLNLRLSWEPFISYSLIAGTLFVAVGTAYLTMVRNRSRKP